MKSSLKFGKMIFLIFNLIYNQITLKYLRLVWRNELPIKMHILHLGLCIQISITGQTHLTFQIKYFNLLEILQYIQLSSKYYQMYLVSWMYHIVSWIIRFYNKTYHRLFLTINVLDFISNALSWWLDNSKIKGLNR